MFIIKPKVESAINSVVDYNQTKQGNIELVNQKLKGVMILEQTATIDNKHQMCMKLKLFCDDGIDESEKENEGLISEEDDSDSDDDWEGIERSDLEKMFAMAADYGKQDDHLQSLGSDIQMQLYGLHKVATEGPCHEAQPIALKLSARSKWYFSTFLCIFFHPFLLYLFSVIFIIQKKTTINCSNRIVKTIFVDQIWVDDILWLQD